MKREDANSRDSCESDLKLQILGSQDEELELFRAIRLSELSHKARLKEIEQQNLKISRKVKEAVYHNRCNQVTHVLKISLPMLVSAVFTPCLHCEDKNVLCLHVSSHDLLLLAKMSRICKVWKEFVDDWYKANASKIEIQAFNGESGTNHDFKLRKRNAHVTKQNVILGYIVSFLWTKEIGLKISKSEKKVHYTCMCKDIRWKAYAKTIGARFQIAVNDFGMKVMGRVDCWENEYNYRNKSLKLTLSCAELLEYDDELPLLTKKIRQLIGKQRSLCEGLEEFEITLGK